jgi:selenocysteine lyase/cysteine desulfurase
MATLVTFRIRGWTPQAALDELGARVFAVARTVPPLDGLRISVGFFTSEAELERFIGCVELLAARRCPAVTCVCSRSSAMPSWCWPSAPW